VVGVHTGLRAFWALTSLVAASLPLPLSPRALSPFEADDDQCFIHDHSFLEERQGKRRGRQRPHQEAVLQIVSSLLRMAHVARMPHSQIQSQCHLAPCFLMGRAGTRGLGGVAGRRHSVHEEIPEREVYLLNEHRHWPLPNQTRGSRLGSLYFDDKN